MGPGVRLPSDLAGPGDGHGALAAGGEALPPFIAWVPLPRAGGGWASSWRTGQHGRCSDAGAFRAVWPLDLSVERSHLMPLA